MWKNLWPITAIALCLQCGGATQTAPPAEESPDSEMAEETEAPSPEGDAGADEEGSSAPNDPKSASPKKACPELTKKDCMITLGCVWNDLKKCVEEGASE